MFSADDLISEHDNGTTYLGDDGRMRVGGRVRREEDDHGMFGSLWDLDDEGKECP